MDNLKTGNFIKELRKEKGMTQKELAHLLHITDKAVSKWERGLCAPDISLFEPLSVALGASVAELIGGERVNKNEYLEELEAAAKNVISYSKKEIANKARLFRKRYLIATPVCIVIVSAICLFSLWRSGRFNVIDRSVSPDGNIEICIYNRNIFSNGIFREPTTAVWVRGKGEGDLRTMDMSRKVQYENTQNVLWGNGRISSVAAGQQAAPRLCSQVELPHPVHNGGPATRV